MDDKEFRAHLRRVQAEWQKQIKRWQEEDPLPEKVIEPNTNKDNKDNEDEVSEPSGQ